MKSLISLLLLSLPLILSGQESPSNLRYSSGKEERELLLGRLFSGCPTVETVQNFDVDAYVSARWYVHEASKTFYFRDGNRCATADYKLLDKKTFWGYTINVFNKEGDDDGSGGGGALCAFQTKKGASKLAVAPCFLPRFQYMFSGPYWVVAYDETEGYSLVSGGQPTKRGDNGCRGKGFYRQGLFILTRSSDRNETLIEKVKGIATDKGFDVGVQFSVDQTDCDYFPRYDGTL